MSLRKIHKDMIDSGLKLDILNEVKITTGELAILNTTNKTNLVNAINEIASNGGGGMAEVEWGDIIDKPVLYSSGSAISGNSNFSKPPSHYYNIGRRTFNENVAEVTLGISNGGDWVALQTFTSYTDALEDPCVQFAYCKTKTLWRYSIGTVTATAVWSAWFELETTSGSQSKVDAHANDSSIHMTSAEKTKLSGIATSANNYTHPTNHPASIITQTTTERFVTDIEKATWNAKADNSSITNHVNDSSVHMTSAEKTKLSGLSNYTHPTNHPSSIITQTSSARFVTDTQITAWNAKADSSSLTNHVNDSSVHMTSTEKTKLSGIASGANNYTHPTNHPSSIITQDSSARFVTDTQITAWNAKADATSIGTLSSLSTSNKTNLVNAVNELFQSVSNGKSAVANAITQKGVATSATAEFATMATNIGKLSTLDTSKYTAIDTNYSSDSFRTPIYSDVINKQVTVNAINGSFIKFSEYEIKKSSPNAILSATFVGELPASNVALDIQIRLRETVVAQGTMEGASTIFMIGIVTSDVVSFTSGDKLQIYVKNRSSSSTKITMTGISIQANIMKDSATRIL